MMTCMNDILDALWSMEFGAALLGALAGGGFTMLGSWFQTKSSNKAANLAMAKAHAQRAFDAITQLKLVLESSTITGLGTRRSRDEWNRELRTQLTTARGAIMLLPDEYKETRLPSLMILRMTQEYQGRPIWIDYQVETDLLLSEARKYLGSLIRGSDVPKGRDMKEVVEQEVMIQRKARWTEELEHLQLAGEMGQTDADDAEREDELRGLLQLPPIPAPAHPADDTDEDAPASDGQNTPS
ncbi:hypothetical protein [Streptomyces sp. NPDC055990]|uniref:hypothetical protein n=2 Tax=unclassified Streptomyces TaxID=2593676 RepID=UPI0035E08B07